MSEHPDLVARRMSPSPVQLQVVLGCILGDGVLAGEAGARRLRVAHRADRIAYARWKYERLAGLAFQPPRVSGACVAFETVVHPLFDDLALLTRAALVDLLRPLGLAVWMTDLGRLELQREAFLPLQREVLAALL